MDSCSQLIMKKGNETHSMLEWTTYLQSTLDKASAMKHERCMQFTEDVASSFKEITQEQKQQVLEVLRSWNRLLASCVVSVLTKWYGDIITGRKDKDTFGLLSYYKVRKSARFRENSKGAN
jgi:hypothetical protein